MSENKNRVAAKRRAAEKARKKKQRTQRWILAIAGVAMLAVLALVFVPRMMGSGRRDVTASAGQSTATAPAAKFTPVPTPSPTPGPTPTPEPEITAAPEPTPTPYAFNTAGRKLSAKKKTIAITFDDGPSSDVTGKVLDVLKKNKVKATFFLLGKNAVKNKSLVQRMVDEGHQIGTHTYDHASLIRITPEEMLKQISDSVWAIEQAGGQNVTVLRPPYGNTNDLVCETIQMPMINWSVDTLDWETRNAKKVYKALVDADLKDGDIILMHDIYKTTYEGVKKALPVLKKRGWQFVTIDELFELKAYPLELGSVYRSARPTPTPAPTAMQNPNG